MVKAIIQLLALLVSPAALAATVLVFCENSVTGIFKPLGDQLQLEGYTLIQTNVARTEWDNVNRPERVADMFSLISATQPSHVLIFGAVARCGTGTRNPDGHGFRTMWNDGPFMRDWARTDIQKFTGNFTSLPFYTNGPGDGRFDLSTFGQLKSQRAVGRVDFSNLFDNKRGLNAQSNQWNSGKERVPLINETSALANYVARDLAWRRGQWQPAKVGLITNGGLFQSTNTAALQANVPGVTWKSNWDMLGRANEDGTDVYSCAIDGQDFKYAGFLSSTSRQMQGVWMHLLRSWEFEVIDRNGPDPNQQGDQGCSRYLQWFLEVTWGFKVDPNYVAGPTFGDGHRKHCDASGNFGAEEMLWGDPTLPPSVVAQVLSAPQNLRVITP